MEQARHVPGLTRDLDRQVLCRRLKAPDQVRGRYGVEAGA